MRLMALLIIVFAVTTIGLPQTKRFAIGDFYSDNAELTKAVDDAFGKLTDSQRVAQMVISVAGRLGRPTETVDALIQEQYIGGVLLLNGTKQSFSDLVKRFNDIALKTGMPGMLYSADAEPSLFNMKIKDTVEVPDTIDIKDAFQAAAVAEIIARELREIGIQQDYAPVVDTAFNDAIISYRSFGTDESKIIASARSFSLALQSNGIVATAKHFPGHGNVKGDSHKERVYIDGEMTELQPYRELIDAGVISIMIGHINVNNNDKYGTNGLPSTCSRNIVTGLLKEELGFNGIIVTDAMWMKALTGVENPDLAAAKAGCDMILMPSDERKCHNDILAEIGKDAAFKEQVYASVKKILRLKLCLGIMQ